MKLWMSSEADKKATRILSKLDIPIEEKFNNYLKDIGYKNEEIVKLRIIIIIRDDNFSAMKGGEEKMKKDRGKPVYSINSRIDYSTFINSNEIKRKELIYRVLLKSMAKLKDKGINNIEVVEDFIEAQISAGV